MEDKVLEAIKLLQKNDYIVKKFTKAMEKDADECEASECNKECLGCACNVCLIQ